MRKGTHLTLVLLATALLGGCESYFNSTSEDTGPVESDGYAQFAGVGLGKTCATSGDCRLGLSCESGTCKAVGKTPKNGACLLSAECAAGLQCGWAGFCVDAGEGDVGTECSSTSNCKQGLFCNLMSLSGVCTAQSATAGDLGAPCAKSVDCMNGLICSPARKLCVPGSLTLNPDLYPGVECNDEGDDAAPFQAVVEMPKDSTYTDFYTLPFPNDLLKKNGHIDVSKHPTPGVGFVGFDAIAGVKEEIGKEMTGFGLTTAIYIRFTRPLDPASVSDPTTFLTDGPSAAIKLIDLKTGQQIGPLTAKFHPDRNKYICRNWLYVHTRWSELLQPGNTYALVVTDGVRPDPKKVPGTTTPAMAPYLKMLTSETAPIDATQVPAWKTYQPLRNWLKGAGASVLPHLIGATQFTTWEPRTWTQQLATAANSALAPSIKDNQWTLCEAGTKSPCADPAFAGPGTDARNCPAQVSKNYYEFHARIILPSYQEGTLPYQGEGSGGNLYLGTDGKPTPHDFKPVCMALTIPKNTTMPVTGWPLIVMAHGTGGNMRSMAASFGDVVSSVQAPNGQSVHFATLGIDQPMHFDRRGGGVTTDPGPLFYNFANPKAARGNFYQGAADNYSLFRWAKNFNGPLTSGVSAKFDWNTFVFFGHSQGSTTGPMFLPYQADPPLAGTILSGCGGSLPYGLLGKKKPYDASVGLRIGMQEMALDEQHPALNLLQYYFEASDPLLYAPQLAWQPAQGKGIHVLHTYGHGDSYTPTDTSRIFAGALHGVAAQSVQPAPTWFDAMLDLGVTVVTTFPISGNITTSGKPLTVVTLQALNDAANSMSGAPYDGHFVLFDDKTLQHEGLAFLASLGQGAPVVIK